MRNIELKRSPDGLNAIILTSGIVALLVAIFATFLIAKIFSWAPNTEHYFTIGAWLLLIFAWIVESLMLWLNWNKVKYEIGPKAIIVHQKNGMFGLTKTLYRYESILKVTMNQGYFGQKFGYGNIYISMPKLEQDIVLRDVADPSQQLAGLQQRIAERSAGSHALIN